MDIVTSESSHITKQYNYLYIYITLYIYQATIYLHSVKCRMTYNPEKNATHGCKLNVEA